MTEIPDTRDSLLVRVRDPGDQEAGKQFAANYRPVAYRWARAHGLQDADAEEWAQSALIAKAKAIAKWEPATPQVRFSHWLRQVAKNATLNALSRRPKDQASGKPIDARSDLFSLGSVLYTMCAGRPPFFAPTPAWQSCVASPTKHLVH